MSEYVWHRAFTEHATGRARTDLVLVLAWLSDAAIVVDYDKGGAWASVEVGATPYRVPLDELRLGYPPEAQAVA